MRSVWGRTAGLHLGAGSRAAARAWSLPSSPCTASVMLPGRGMGRQLAAAGCSEVLSVQAPAGGGLLCITRCRWGNGLGGQVHTVQVCSVPCRGVNVRPDR